MTTHTLACALCGSGGGTDNGLGTALAWFLGIPFGIALFAGALRVLFGWGGGNQRRQW